MLEKSHLLTIVDKLQDGMIVVDNQNRITYINKTAAKLYDVNPEQTIGTKLSHLQHRGLSSFIRDISSLNWTDKKSMQSPVEHFIKKNGDELWVDAKVSPLLDQIDQPAGFFIVIHDNTKEIEMQNKDKYSRALKAEAEHAIKNICNQVQEFFKGVNIPFFMLNSELKFTYVNKALENILRKKAKELLGQSIERMIPRIKETILYRRLISETDKSFNIREFFKPLEIWIDCTVYLWRENNTRHIGVQLRDASESFALERKLNESEKRYRQLVNSIWDPFFALNKNLRIIYWNKGAEKIFETSAKETIGKHLNQLQPFANEKGLDKVFYHDLSNGKSRSFTQKMKIKNKEYIFEILVYPSAEGLSILLKDTTDMVKMQEKLRFYSKHLEELVWEKTNQLKDAERLAAIGETAGMVGHDIRNPLQSMDGAIWLAKEEIKALPDGGKTRKELEEILHLIKEQVNYIDHMVADLQDFARREKPQTEEIGIHELLVEALAMVEFPENVKVNNIYGEDFELEVDPTQMKRVFINIIKNAFQSMPNGGELTIRASSKGEIAWINFEDTGVGINEEDRPKMFTPLFTTKSKGQGFGLAVCKKLIEAHGGEITFESEKGKGTTFTIKLPLKRKTRTQNIGLQ